MTIIILYGMMKKKRILRISDLRRKNWVKN
jgi:hypothetical protein